MNARYNLHTLRDALSAIVAVVLHVLLMVDGDCNRPRAPILKPPCISALSMAVNTYDSMRTPRQSQRAHDAVRIQRAQGIYCRHWQSHLIPVVVSTAPARNIAGANYGQYQMTTPRACDSAHSTIERYRAHLNGSLCRTRVFESKIGAIVLPAALFNRTCARTHSVVDS